jgi:membrane protease YdiL (CAAX protease family)
VSRAAGERPVRAALSLVLAIVAVEYVARHVIAPLLPVLAAPRVNDMLVSGVAYLALSLVVAKLVGAGGPVAAMRGVLGAAGRWEAWMGGLLGLLTLLIGLVDRWLLEKVRLPSFDLVPHTTTFAAHAWWLVPASMLLVNGLVIPVAEEWLWRGVVQPRLVTRWGAPLGIGVTAVLFSVKHAIVDASLGRLLMIIAGGVILGWVARRATWKASALSHVMMNTVATVLALAVELVKPTCMSPEPTLPPVFQRATDRVLALIDAPNSKEVADLFAPAFLKHFTVPTLVEFFEGVHSRAGHCAWQCTTSLGYRRVSGLVACDKRKEHVTLQVEEDPPYRINYLTIRALDAAGQKIPPP